MRNLLQNWFAQRAEMSDEDLIRHYQERGESKFLGELFCRYAGWLSAIALRITKNEQDAEDLLMDCYEIMAKDLMTTGVRNFQPWAGAVVRHRALKLVKSRKGESQVQEEGLEQEVDDWFEKEKELSSMMEKLSELKPEQRKCVELFYLKDKSYNDISEETGFPMTKVKSYIQNGKRNLRIMIEKEQEASQR